MLIVKKSEKIKFKIALFFFVLYLEYFFSTNLLSGRDAEHKEENLEVSESIYFPNNHSLAMTQIQQSATIYNYNQYITIG